MESHPTSCVLSGRLPSRFTDAQSEEQSRTALAKVIISKHTEIGHSHNGFTRQVNAARFCATEPVTAIRYTSAVQYAPVSDPIAEATSRTIAQNEMHGFYTMFTPLERLLSLSRSGERSTHHSCGYEQPRVSCSATDHHGKLENHAKAIPTGNIEIDVPGDY